MDNNILLHIFNQQINGQQPLLLIVLVFIGGIISSLSPCSLGLLPVIIGYVGGNSDSTSKKTIIQVLFFVLGLSLTLTVLGIISAMAGAALGSFSKPFWAIIMASLIMIMGLSLLEIIEIPVPVIIKKMPQNKSNNLIIYPIILGISFAFATTPCSTPILASILAYTSFKANIALGALLLFFFSFGQGIILIMAGIFTSLFKKILLFRTFTGHFVKVCGVILILSSFYIYLKVFGVL